MSETPAVERDGWIARFVRGWVSAALGVLVALARFAADGGNNVAIQVYVSATLGVP